MSGEVELIGMKDIQKILSELTPRYATNLSRSFVHGLASETAKLAKKNAPVSEWSGGGELKKSIKAKRRKSKPEQPKSDVVVNSFYWFMVENGTGGKNPHPEQPFMRPALDLIKANMPRIIDEQFTKKLTALINREKKKAAKV